MALYLTKNVQFATKVEAFEKRGLSGQVAVRAGEAGVHVLTEVNLENAIRFSNLHREIPARIAGRPVLYSGHKMSNLLPKFKGPSLFEAPTLIVEMKTGGEVLNSFGMFEAGTGKMGLYAGKPSTDQLRDISSVGLDMYSTVPAGNVNLSGYLAYVTAWRGIQAIYAMGGSRDAAHMSLVVSEEAGRKVGGSEAVEQEEDDEGTMITPAKGAVPPGGTITWEDIRLVTGSALNAASYRLIRPTESPSIRGHMLPYFREMLDADPDSTFAIFIRLFKMCIADSEEELAESLIVYRRGFRYLASTQAGRIIQHIYFCLDIGIQLGAKVHMIRDGSEYAGCVVETREPLLYKNRVVRALEAEDISKQLSLLNSHSAAIQKIYDMVFEFGRSDDRTEEVTIEELLVRPRALREMIMARRAEDIDGIRTILNELIAELKYAQSYWEVTPENIVRFLSSLNGRNSMKDEPMYVHIDVLTNRSSEVLSYLSVFGGQAPSIYFGDTVKMIAPIGKEDPNLVIAGGKRVVPHVPYIVKGLVAAAGDWVSVSRLKSFKFKAAKPRRGGQVAGFSGVKDRDGLIANPHFDAFYTILRTWVFSGHGESAGSGKGKKRAIVDSAEDMDDQPLPKRTFRFL